MDDDVLTKKPAFVMEGTEKPLLYPSVNKKRAIGPTQVGTIALFPCPYPVFSFERVMIRFRFTAIIAITLCNAFQV
ncbi:MAG: hypothetical protein AB2397_02790 [Exiguobacterium alkaliphilum]